MAPHLAEPLRDDLSSDNPPPSSSSSSSSAPLTPEEEEYYKKKLSRRWVDTQAMHKLGAHAMSDRDRVMLLDKLAKPLAETQPGEIGEVLPMGFLEQALMVAFFLAVLGPLYVVPSTLLYCALYVRDLKFYAVFIPVFIFLSSYPLKRWHEFTHSWFNQYLFRYFSFRFAWTEVVRGGEPYLFIAPPHGVLPFANILSIHGMRNLLGIDFRGITTDAALKMPFLRHYMTWIGIIPASPGVVKKHVEEGWSIGISSGGVAEIFETNNDHEVVLMKERKGFVKLALRTGATIVPCYMFGNTALLHLWYDPFGILCCLSRFLKAGVVCFWGRWGLPVMYRVGCVGCTGKPIRVKKVEGEPTKEQIDAIHKEFLVELEATFDTFKRYYGWSHKKLVIK